MKDSHTQSILLYQFAVGISEDKLEVEVVGDLTEEEAHKFVYGDGVAGGWPGIIREQWPAIYERCGGNIGLLQQCVAGATRWGNWDAGLNAVVTGPLEAVSRGFKPKVYIVKGGEAPLWTKDQWKIVLERITRAPHHAVLASEIEEELGKGCDRGGDEILLSMVKYNLLALRPPSDLARDLPREVYGRNRAAVVTLPLPAHAWAAKVLLED